MADVYKVSGLFQYEVIVKPYTTETVEFLDVRPNYFRVQNFGDSRIFCGTSKVPTEHDFDFVCKPDGLFMYSEPTGRGFLYIYNPSGNDARVKIVAFAHTFDPLTLAFSGIELDFSGVNLETNNVITGFNAALPAGTNNIGKVNVANFPATMPTAANQTETIAKIGDIYKQEYVDHVTVLKSSNHTGQIPICNGGGIIIHLLVNDGDTDLNLSLGGQSIPLKSGESITDLKFIGSVNVNGSNITFRAMVSYPF